MDALMQHMMRYTQALFIHMARGSVCIRHHSLDQQLARWLLLHDDRIDGAEMQITQECIAHTLGVRRESITGCAMKLQLAGVISYRRGHLTILSRSGLEDRCCECYPLVKNAYDRLANDCKSASQSSTYTHDTKICNQDPALKRYA
jgi:hypothetical protein